jgi:DNA (cytosine-5)-methyltransferase 1
VKTFRYGSICSGIEAASVAWHGLGWEPAFFAEIEPFPSAVLKERFPDVPNLGDFTKIQEAPGGAIDLLVGGTPCQSFSVAGKRAGLDDPRGNLTLEFLALASRLRPRYLLWENVPGVLSIDGGRTFGAFLGLLGKLGYGFAYRVLDAQFFGVPQRRRRVFVVGCLGDWRRAAAVLFESSSLSGDLAPSRAKGEGVAGAARESVDRSGYELAHALRGEGFDVSEDGSDRGTPLVPVAFQSNQSFDSGRVVQPMACDLYNGTESDGAVPTFGAASGSANHAGPKVRQGFMVRRLTPVECERLQGFPDGWTAIPWRGKAAELCPDGPRYKAIGNSMAVPVMRWIGERISMVKEIVS